MATSPWPRALVPFRSDQYRLLAGSFVLSLVGSGIWTVTVAWRLLDLGHGPAGLAMVASTTTAALVVTALAGGVLADRLSRRNLIARIGAVKAASVATVVAADVTGEPGLPQLIVVAAVLGGADGIFFPAYSASVPSVIPEAELLAVNSIESLLRPVMLQAAGPLVASALIGLASPVVAWAGTAVAFAGSAACAAGMRRDPARVNPPGGGLALRQSVTDLRSAVVYVATTRWLVATLVFAVAVVLAYAGPIQVLLPAVVRDHAHGGPEDLALVTAGYGAGAIGGSLVMASTLMPRRYLTAMLLMWGVACVPLAVMGLSDHVWLMALALSICGALVACAGALWGTLLQRRVPHEMLGRVSSLDFFVSLSAAPVSAALVVPAAEAWGIPAVYLVAGIAPLTVAVLALTLGGLRRDELAHPLR
ncbi:hypothetical protein CC117_02650 [Parafrankia colletiae]|uniref:MFS transporter n=1 Tax=Parafrankia colletiae TaxID=573497 RepID=A0A1S1QXG1_9ACTN|nr:MFS transporter [Parafrankia colletiae]MCK9899093.1 MFS transporter [Frankia sp. Cpl3]OHV38660.1 hypothetical protein CC117_02650 [Parafrankia colletiae]